MYPAWRWFEKQDAIRSFQKKDKDSAPEFYNIFLERPKVSNKLFIAVIYMMLGNLLFCLDF